MYIVGKSREESDKIINKLFNIVENFNKKYVHKWTDGDVLHGIIDALFIEECPTIKKR